MENSEAIIPQQLEENLVYHIGQLISALIEIENILDYYARHGLARGAQIEQLAMIARQQFAHVWQELCDGPSPLAAEAWPKR